MSHIRNLSNRTRLACIGIVGTAGLIVLIAAGSGLVSHTPPPAVLPIASAIALSAPAPTEPAAAAQMTQDYGKIPQYFEANRGQTDPEVKFLSRGRGYTLLLTAHEALLALSRKGKRGNETADQTALVHMKVLGSNTAPDVSGIDPQECKTNYFIGNDKSKWIAGVPTFAKVKCAEIYPSIDVVYYGNQKQFEYDFIVRPGANPETIRLGFDGVETVSVNEAGELVLKTAGGEVCQHKPIVYQNTDTGRQMLDGDYVVHGENEVAFQVGDYDHSLPLVIDPVLSYSTYLGGSQDDWGTGIVVDSGGTAYVCGYTNSVNFPRLVTAFQFTLAGGYDAFAAKFNAAGTQLMYCTYLGGASNDDKAFAITVGFDGEATITGSTKSTNFPTTPGALQTTLLGTQSAFVTKLGFGGGFLRFSTYLGGDNSTTGLGTATDSNRDVYVTGSTNATAAGGFPAAGFQSTLQGTQNAFVAKISAFTGAKIYCTYLGGNATDSGNGIAVDGSFSAYVTGSTTSNNFPHPGGFQTTLQGAQDAFVTKVNSAGTGLGYSTYLGGTGTDTGFAIALDSSNNAYVTGSTTSTNFPGAGGGYQSSLSGSMDAFVTKINSTGSATLFSTYLGGSGKEEGRGIAVDAQNAVYVIGNTDSNNFPSSSGLQTFSGGPSHGNAVDGDAFVTKFSPAGTTVVYSTYLGGSDSDQGLAIAVDAGGAAYITGATFSANFPTANPLYLNNGGFDPFVAKLAPGTPTITSFNPPNNTAGTGSFTLTVNGTNFNTTSTIFFNGNFHTTTFINGTTLTAVINAAEVAAAGAYPVTIQNGTLDGGNSAPSNYTIIPGVLHHFDVTGFTSPATAGSAGSITVTAKDPANLVIPGYTGTITITSSDAKAILPVTSYPFTLGDNGSHVFSGIILKTSGLQTITVTDSGKTGNQVINVSSASVDHLVVSGFPSSQTAGNPAPFTVAAQDIYLNTATDYVGTVVVTSSDIQASLPSTYTFTPADHGARTFSGRLSTVGTQSITAQDQITTTLIATQSNINITPAAAFRLSVTGFTSPAVAGVADNVTVTVQDQFGNTVPSYSGTIGFQCNDPQVNPVTDLPANYPFVPAIDSGVHTFVSSVTLKTVGTRQIMATDTNTPSINGAEVNITVNPSTAVSLIVTGFPSPNTAGTSGSFTVTAKDAFNNVATGYTGTVKFTSSDPIATLASNYDFTSGASGDNGVHTFSETLNTSGPQTISTTDKAVGTITGTQGGIIITSASAVGMTLNGFPANPVAGTPGNFTVTARDSFGNPATGYTGTIAFTSSDPQAGLPSNYTFAPSDNGFHVFNGVLKTAGAKSITATDVVTSSITATQSPITVKPAPNAKVFTVSGYTSPSTAGTPGSVTVTALDQFGNVATGYTGTATMSSSDSAALFAPLSYAYQGSDNGVHSFNVTLKTAGTQSITATDSTITGSQNGIVINAGSFSQLQLVSPATVNVGSPFNVTVNAVDAYNNFINTPTDNVGITTSDANATPPNPATLVAGTKSFSVTLQTTGAQTLTASDLSNLAITAATKPVTVNTGSPARLLVIVPGEALAAGTLTGKTGSPSTATAGTPISITVFAVDAGNNPVNSTDTLSFSSTDSRAILPQPPPLVLVAGTATFSLTLGTVGTQTITATDTTNSNVPTYTSSGVPVQAGALAALRVSGFPLSLAQATVGPFTVTGVDSNGNAVPSYLGTVHFTSSDPNAILPADYTFIAGNNSSKSFSATLNTVGTQSLTATDTVTATVTGTQSNIIIGALLPTLTTISPDAGVLNGAVFTVTVNGTNFLSTSVVQWKGSPRSTTFVSTTQLTATIPASDLATAGQAAVTVFTPAPGGGTSNVATFFVYSGATSGTWIVINTNDAGAGSLRFAMDNMRKGDTVIFDPTLFDLTSADAATVINVLKPLHVMDQGKITIDAQDRRVTVNGAGANSSAGLEITSSNNTVLGLSIVGFSQSGVLIHSGAQNNVIGGSRLMGAGPNGQGLRLSNNGAYGLEIDDVGTNGNVVKGCWIGLDAAGTNAEPNLAGVIIQKGAQLNTIGGTGNGEANVISGNKFEGITITDTGSDNNTIVGNIVGMSGVQVAARDDSAFGTRSGVGNGSAGIFLSKGTQGSTVGGTTDAEGNLIGSNGGNGIEVRAKGSKHNASRGNRITNNARGGIALFDGSNDGIQPPTIDGAVVSRSAPASTNGRAAAATHITGSAPSNGFVEVFSDTGSQGASLVGRTTVTSGRWDVDAKVDTALNITATFTDMNGNTSPFAVFSPSNANPGLANLPTDLQSALSALTPDPTTTLFGGLPAAAPSTLTLNLVAIKLNLASPGSDTIQIAATMPTPSGFTFAGQVMAVYVGGVAKLVTLDSKGSASGAVALKFSKPKGGTAKFSAKFAKGAYAATLATAGLGTASGTVALKVYVVFNKIAYAATPNVSYSVKAGKSGTAKFSQK